MGLMSWKSTQATAVAGSSSTWPTETRAVLFDEIRQLASSTEVVQIVETSSAISLLPTGRGFPITVNELEDGQFVLSLGGLHEEGYGPEYILEVIKRCLSGEMIIETTSLNGSPWKITRLARGELGTWKEMAHSAYVRFALFRKATTTRVLRYPERRERST